jgi:hypothetical protein
MNLRVALRAGVVLFCAGIPLAAREVRAESQAKAPGALDLSGRWRLNKELSDDEEAKLRAAAVSSSAERQPADPGSSGEAEAQGSEGGRGGRGGGTGGRTAHTSPLQGVDENDPRGATRTAGRPDTLTVTQVESEIVVEETPGRKRELYPNGKTYKTDEGVTQIRTLWSDGKLMVEEKNVRGWRLVETWDLAPDRSRLSIHLLLKGGSRPKLVLTRVYDRDASTPK